MHKFSITALIAVCGLAAMPMGAADAAWKASFTKHWHSSVELSMAVAEAMPADGYSYIPPSTVEPQERTFAGLLVHFTQSDAGAFGRVSGMKPPAPVTDMSKEAVLKYMKEAFDFCDKALDSMTDEQLAKVSGAAGREMSGSDALFSAFTHTAHTRGQAEVYLRLKNVKPPAYKF